MAAAAAIPAAIGAAGLVAGLITGKGKNRASRREAKRHRDWQERMSNTSFQRGMTDMRAAGLNPIFAYQKGGAVTPSGSQALMSDPGMTAAALSSAGTGTGRAIVEARRISQDIRTSSAQEGKLKTAQTVDKANAELAMQQAITSAVQARSMEQDVILKNTKIPKAKIIKTFDENVLGPILNNVEGWTSSAKKLWNDSRPRPNTTQKNGRTYIVPSDWSDKQ